MNMSLHLIGEAESADGFTDSESEFLSSPPPPGVAPRAGGKVAGLLRRKFRVFHPQVNADGEGDEYRVYMWRWFMLATLCLLNVSNGMMWLTFAPIPNYTAALYGITASQVNWFSISFFVVTLLVGFVAIAILDIFGLRVSLYLGAGFNLFGSVLRWVSISPSIICSHYMLSGYAVAMGGQILTACAQPFLLYAPTKLASYWFGPKERAFCTMLASLGNPIGLALALLISPQVVTSLDKFQILHLIFTVPAAVGAVCTVVAYWKNRPATPPAPSAHRNPTPFLRGLVKALTTPSFLILLGIWGFSSGVTNAFVTLLAQILCPYGYTDRESGLWGALAIFSGLVGATCGGLLIDFFKLFKEVAVVSLSLAMLCLIWFIQVFTLTGQAVNIAICLCAFGFFALPLIPACMELGVEVTYPVSEATSTGLLWSMTQVTGIVLVLMAQEMQQELRTSESQCGVEQVSNSSSVDYVCRVSSPTPQSQDRPMDFTYPLIFYLIVGVLALMVMVIFFRPEYKRLKAEKRANTMNRLQEGPYTKELEESDGDDDGGAGDGGAGDGAGGNGDSEHGNSEHDESEHGEHGDDTLK